MAAKALSTKRAKRAFAGIIAEEMSIPRVETELGSCRELGADQPSEAAAPKTYECDLCAGAFEGPPGGSGLLLWTRGDELRFEEPPLCEQCASEITIGALMRWQIEEEEEG
jgi:hypothetical protein